MKICYISGYWGKNTDRVLGYRPDLYRNAYLFVWAVKEGTFLKNFYVMKRGDERFFIKSENIRDARRLFGRFVEHQVNENGWSKALIVHVPSKDAVAHAPSPRSLVMLTEAMSHTGLAGSISDALRWSKALGKAHEGGERKRKELLDCLKLSAEVEGRDVVLVDDLVTRGGSMLASKDVLEAAGANVVGAIACGRTMYDADIKAFGRQSFELTDELDDLGRLLA